MQSPDFADELELTELERRALDLLLQSMAAACRRRLPRTLELVGVGIEFQRPCPHELLDAPLPLVGDATEELH